VESVSISQFSVNSFFCRWWSINRPNLSFTEP